MRGRAHARSRSHLALDRDPDLNIAFFLAQAARQFYEAEALRGGWSVRQLDRQIATQFYERTERSRDKYALRSKVLAREYRLALPDEETLAAEIVRRRRRLAAGRMLGRRRG